MQVRRILIAAVAAVGMLVPVAVTTPGVAVAARGKSAKVAKATAKPAKTTNKAKATKSAKTNRAVKRAKPVKPVRPVTPARVKFAATGVLTAVDAVGATATVAVKGGTNDVRGRTVTFAVTATTRVTLDDAPATLDQLQAGFAVAVTGDRAGSVHTVLKINATSPEPEPTPTTEPTEEPTIEPTTEPTIEPTVEPTA